MITEYNKHIQGFMVSSVETIQRLNWERVKEPPSLITNRMGGVITAVAELTDHRLVMILDVEKILSDAGEFYDESVFEGINKVNEHQHFRVLFADDSTIARKQIARTLDAMGVEHISAINGADAWYKLEKIAAKCAEEGRPITSEIQIVLTDVEMPELDGYVLTQQIKADPRMAGLPVIMHSSLTAEANQAMGKGVGADAYIPKFHPRELAHAIVGFLAE